MMNWELPPLDDCTQTSTLPSLTATTEEFAEVWLAWNQLMLDTAGMALPDGPTVITPRLVVPVWVTV